MGTNDHHPSPRRRLGFLGPPGTFTEEAALGEPTLAGCDLVAFDTMPEVLAGVTSGTVDVGLVAIENSIEGTVNQVVDGLVFDVEALILGEVLLRVRQNLLAPPGAILDGIRRVVSFPVAVAQCQGFLHAHLPRVAVVAANSTAEAARSVAELADPTVAAVGTELAARLYGLEVLAPAIEDHHDNTTRFVVVGPADAPIPAPTGHDKTTIVCFQEQDQPGSLHAILGQFSARSINLTKLESRPTKHSLGDYCFIIDLEGHVASEVVADCLRDLHAQVRDLRFLGSYPAAGEHGAAIRRDAEEAWRRADAWVGGLRRRVVEATGRAVG